MSDRRLEDALTQLAQAQLQTEAKLQALIDRQSATEDKFTRLTDLVVRWLSETENDIRGLRVEVNRLIGLIEGWWKGNGKGH